MYCRLQSFAPTGLVRIFDDNPGRCPGLSSVGLTALRNARELVSFVSALADEIAHTAVPHGGISFGTNDLTQTAPGMSRDDSGSFLPGYAELEIVRKKSLRMATLCHD